MKFQLTSTQIALVLSVFIPGIVQLIVKSRANARVKQFVLLAVSTVGGWFATSAAANTPYNLKEVLTAIGVTFLFSTASYFGLRSFVAAPVESATGTVGLG